MAKTTGDETRPQEIVGLISTARADVEIFYRNNIGNMNRGRLFPLACLPQLGVTRYSMYATLTTLKLSWKNSSKALIMYRKM